MHKNKDQSEKHSNEDYGPPNNKRLHDVST